MAGDIGLAAKPYRATVAKGFGTLETEILDIIWGMGTATSRDIFEKMRDRRPLGQSTVLTVLRRLSNRGILDRQVGHGAYVYSANISREDLGGHLIDNVIDRVFRGAIDPVVDHLTREP